MCSSDLDNILSGVVDNITCGELCELPKDTVLFDVRTAGEVSGGTIENSIHIPVDSLRQNIASLDKAKSYVVFCAVGIRAYIACRIMKQNGIENVRNLAGGYTTYRVVNEDYTKNKK